MLPVNQLSRVSPNYSGSVYSSRSSWVGLDSDGVEHQLCQVWDFVNGRLVGERVERYAACAYRA